ncbi:unnamed protein product [Peniophora sp. CBMAI 1063]|nr:unnamed protein product [Peniophora sp. CBMAI 1063]
MPRKHRSAYPALATNAKQLNSARSHHPAERSAALAPAVSPPRTVFFDATLESYIERTRTRSYPDSGHLAEIALQYSTAVPPGTAPVLLGQWAEANTCGDVVRLNVRQGQAEAAIAKGNMRFIRSFITSSQTAFNM